MITIGFSTRKDNPNFINYIKKTCRFNGVEVIQKINNGEKSLSQVYNEIINESSNDVIVLCHDDIEFETDNWGDKILDHFRRNSDYGILGLAGSKFLNTECKWWTVPHTMYGIVNHKNEGKKWTSNYSKDLGKNIEDVVLVDGLFIALNKERIVHLFDETIPGFHFYDLGFCIPNYLDGVNVGVIFDVRVTHLSIGMTNDSWETNRVLFSEKHKDELPLEIIDDDYETFIFIHDQDYLLDFEKKNKLGNLYSYKYVFLGNRPTDKIKNLDNVIIARNLEYNIEQYPKLTSYTGWYALWKNNLITKKYVNLFEYDVIFNENIEQYLHRFRYEHFDMVGYVPVSMMNFHFIQNERWVEHIIPSIKKHYGIDIYNVFNTIISQNPNSIWSSTSNTTFKTEVFKKYMKWFEPIFEDVKLTETAGHAHERSLTFFSTLNKKNFVITENLLKHFQLDSHSTQGHNTNIEVNYDKLVNNVI